MLTMLIHIIKKNTEALLVAGLEVNTALSIWLLLATSVIANEQSESAANFKYLGTIGINQNCIHEDTKVRLNSENACYHSVQNLLSSRFLSKNLD
jgi:hypothetical protein